MKYLRIITLIFLLWNMLVSCQSGQDPIIYPDVSKNRWSINLIETPPSAHIIRKEWWKLFNDEHLNKLIKQAMTDSLELGIAHKRIEEANLAIQGSRWLPSVQLSGNTSISKQKIVSSDTVVMPSSESGPSLLSNTANLSESFNLGSSISWEADLWGKKKHGSAINQAGYQESKAQYIAELLKLVSEIALAYFDIRQKDRELILAGKSCKDNRKILTIYKNQFAEGITDESKVLRQINELKNSENEILTIQQNRKQLENRIATLIGKPAGEFVIPEAENNKDFQMIGIPVGLPSELLERRPDIIAAKYRICKAHHRIYETKAASLPSISLTGTGGFVSSALSLLLKQWTFGITPSISMNLFDGGVNQRQLESQQIQSEIARKEYLITIMRAFEEVENILSGLEKHLKEKEMLAYKSDSAAHIHRQLTEKANMGIVSELEIMESRKEIYRLEKSVMENSGIIIKDSINLYKALGGGWDVWEYQYIAKSSVRPRIIIEQMVIEN